MDAILALLSKTGQTMGPRDRDLISSPGDSAAANPAPLCELVFRKPWPQFGDEDTDPDQEFNLPTVA